MAGLRRCFRAFWTVSPRPPTNSSWCSSRTGRGLPNWRGQMPQRAAEFKTQLAALVEQRADVRANDARVAVVLTDPDVDVGGHRA